MITLDEYEENIRQEIRLVVEKQEQLGLDVLVHGEAERNDMVDILESNWMVLLLLKMLGTKLRLPLC